MKYKILIGVIMVIMLVIGTSHIKSLYEENKKNYRVERDEIIRNGIRLDDGDIILINDQNYTFLDPFKNRESGWKLLWQQENMTMTIETPIYNVWRCHFCRDKSIIGTFMLDGTEFRVYCKPIVSIVDEQTYIQGFYSSLYIKAHDDAPIYYLGNDNRNWWERR